MPEQNQPIQGNFGGIFQTNTPTLDRVAQQLQQNYADRRAYLQKEDQNTEEVLNKEMANVRSIDTPDIIDAYNQYKSSKQNQLFNKGIQSNPKAYAVAQMDANAKYANLMSMINKSSQYNAFGKQIAANRFAKPDNYSDDAGDMLSTFYQTPMDQLTSATYKGKPVDLTNADNWRYAGGNFDFSKLHTTASGKPVTHYDDGTTDESGVQTTQHGYSFGNTPGQYRNTYLGGLAGAEASRAARFSWNQHSNNQQDLDQLDAAYQNSPNWQKLGIPAQTLPPYNPADPVGNEATYQAKQYLVSMNPAEVAAKRVVDAGALQNLTAKNRLHGQEVMAAINENNAEKKLAIRHTYKQSDTAEQSRILDESVGNMVQSAMKDPDKALFNQSNPGDITSITKQYKLDVGPELKNALSIQDPDDIKHRIDADDVIYDPTKGTVTPIFYLPGKPHTLANIDRTYSKAMTMPEFKATFGKTYFGTREAAKESGTPGTKTTTSTTTKTGASGVAWQ